MKTPIKKYAAALALALLLVPPLAGCALVDEIRGGADVELAPETTWPAEEPRSFGLKEAVFPRWLFNKPEHYEFSTAVSNNDPVNGHPAQWAGQDWDPALWGPGFTPETVLRRLYLLHVFNAQYAEKGVPVLELGPRFWKLSSLDQGRAVKLLADHTKVFEQGHPRIVLRDWHTKDNVGVFTPHGGLQLK